MTPSTTALDIVTQFSTLVGIQKDYQAASLLLDEHKFKFSSPKESFESKDDWLNRFPSVHKKDGPSFEEPQAAESDETGDKVIRKGSKKVGFMTFTVLETYTVDPESGKIIEINAAVSKN